jgi:hypothetical protein
MEKGREGVVVSMAMRGITTSMALVQLVLMGLLGLLVGLVPPEELGQPAPLVRLIVVLSLAILLWIISRRKEKVMAMI